MPTRIYLSSDASAPTYSQAGGNSVQNILDACLVNGYGSRTAAGWSIAYTGTLTKVYRPGGTGPRHYLRVYQNGPFSCGVRAYHDMTAWNAGTDPYPTVGQVAGEGINPVIGNNFGGSQYAWAMVANEYYFHIAFFLADKSEMVPGFSSSFTTNQVGGFLFGRFKSYLGTDNSPYVIQNFSSDLFAANSLQQSALSGLYMSADAQNISKSIGVGRHYMGSSGVMGGTNAPYIYADPHTGALYLQSKVRLLESNLGSILWRGEMPGLAFPLSNISPLGCSNVVGSGALAGKTFFALPVQTSAYSQNGYYCYDLDDWGN